MNQPSDNNLKKNFAEEANDDQQDFHLGRELLIVPLKDLVVFPTMIVSIYIQSPEMLVELLKAKNQKLVVGLVSEKKVGGKNSHEEENLYRIGTTAAILDIVKGKKDEHMLILEGLQRFRVKDILQMKPTIKVTPELIAHGNGVNLETEALVQTIKDLMFKTSEKGKTLPDELFSSLQALNEPEQIADIAASYITLDVRRKQSLLEQEDLEIRLKKIINYLHREIQLLDLKEKIQTDVNKEMNKNERNFLLRQELKAIKKQLGEKDSSGMPGFENGQDQTEIKELQKKIMEAKMSPEAEKVALQELERLKKIFPYSPEFTVARTYIETLYSMPWNKSCSSKIDIKKARKILDEDHYGLEKIKERILEYLAVCQMNKSKCGSTILCFVGPPGVGKTSLGKSVARALGRKFIHTSLGGVRDEADIRGHRRTYVGSLPGRIIQNIQRAECNDPVFMLDEIDKLGNDFHGDPESALLEVLDPEQNSHFTDHYLDIPFDLSRSLFITTANMLDDIAPALLDRMEIIEIAGYTEEEKVKIAQQYLIPKQLKLNGLEHHTFELTDEAILLIIRSYTSEAGLRELEREIAKVCRKVAKEFLEKKKQVLKITKDDIEAYLGVEQYEFESAEAKDMVGVATGLAWTMSGGDIIFVEATKMKGSKSLILTGSLGEVMEESARAALSYVRSNANKLGIKETVFDRFDIHIHIPEGATPKDGPSAGITMTTALVSLLTDRKVRRDLAMTGEITLTGRVLPIGGLKEKLLAAKRARITTVVIPERNRKDLTEIPKHLLKGLTIKFVNKLDEIFDLALLPAAVEPAKAHRTKAKKKKRMKIPRIVVKRVLKLGKQKISTKSSSKSVRRQRIKTRSSKIRKATNRLKKHVRRVKRGKK